MYKNLSAKYYQENKEIPQKETNWQRYQNLSKEEKEKKQHYGCATLWLWLWSIEKNISE